MTPSDPTTASPAALLHTPLHALHLELGAKMVPFAGYAMPVSYPQGILAEHRQCRESAVLFDVSHMGQLRLTGDDAAAALETLVPVDIVGLAPGKQRYALFTNDAGGILDDLMVTRRDDHLFLVVNAACKEADTAHLRAHLSTRCLIEPLARARAARAAGTEGRRGHAAPRPRARQAHLHDRRRGDDPRHRLLRDPLRLHRRGRLRDLGRRRRSGSARPGPARRARSRARRPRRPRHAAAGGGPVPLRPRHRHHHHAGAGRPHLGDPEGAPPRRRARRRLSGRGRDRRAARQRRADASGSASSASSGCRCARARTSSTTPVRRSAASPAARSGRASASRSPWPTCRARSPSPGTVVHADVRGKRQPMRVSPLPFAPHRYFRG